MRREKTKTFLVFKEFITIFLLACLFSGGMFFVAFGQEDDAEESDVKQEEIEDQNKEDILQEIESKEQEEDEEEISNLTQQSEKEEEEIEVAVDALELPQKSDMEKIEDLPEKEQVQKIEEVQDIEVVEEKVEKEEAEPEPQEETENFKGKIIFTEVLIGQSGFSKNEFIEIANTTDEKIDLDDWKLIKLTKSGNKSNLVSSSKFKGGIEGEEYFVVAHPSFASLENVDLDYSGSSYSVAKNNAIVLYDDEGNLVDSLCWGEKEYECEGVYVEENPKDNFSLARIDWEKDKFAQTNLLTPGQKNKFPEEKDYPTNILITEFLPNPDGKDKNNEWAELFNDNDFEVDLEGWFLQNFSGKRFEIEKRTILPKSFVVVEAKDTSFYIRNSNEELSFFDPSGKRVDFVIFEGSASSGLSYNRNNNVWHWSRFLTPGSENKFNSLPKIKIKKTKKVYKDVYAYFDASKTKDADGDNLKFRWDFGDGHKSYLKETKHKYKKKGKYKVILEVDDGSTKAREEFKVEVKSFPDYELGFTELLPNPEGKDSGKEFIVIRNYDKKKINLKGYTLATGRNKTHLVNHPVYEDFVIYPGKDKQMFAGDICKFSLLNKRGVIALLYPNGEIADIVRYSKERILEDERYYFSGENWEWIVPETEIEVKGESTEEENYKEKNHFDWSLVTKIEKERICGCYGKIQIENWKQKYSKFLLLLRENPINVALL